LVGISFVFAFCSVCLLYFYPIYLGEKNSESDKRFSPTFPVMIWTFHDLDIP